MAGKKKAEAGEGGDGRPLGKDDNGGTAKGGIAGKQLRTIVERIERLQEERKSIGDDIRDVYAEAKGQGFDTKILRKAVRIHGQDQMKRQEEEAVLDLYLHALGIIPDPEENI